MAPNPSKSKTKRNVKQATTTGPHFHKTTASSSSSKRRSSSVSPHIRLPPLSSGNPPLRSLLTDEAARTRYMHFMDRPFVPIHNITRSFIDSLHIPKLHEFLSCQPMSKVLIDYNAQIFPGMVGQFFANLRYLASDSHVIVTRVNNITLRIDYTLLNTIFGTTLDESASTLYYWDDNHLWPNSSPKFQLSELRTMF